MTKAEIMYHNVLISTAEEGMGYVKVGLMLLPGNVLVAPGMNLVKPGELDLLLSEIHVITGDAAQDYLDRVKDHHGLPTEKAEIDVPENIYAWAKLNPQGEQSLDLKKQVYGLLIPALSFDTPAEFIEFTLPATNVTILGALYFESAQILVRPEIKYTEGNKIKFEDAVYHGEDAHGEYSTLAVFEVGDGDNEIVQVPIDLLEWLKDDEAGENQNLEDLLKSFLYSHQEIQ